MLISSTSKDTSTKTTLSKSTQINQTSHSSRMSQKMFSHGKYTKIQVSLQQQVHNDKQSDAHIIWNDQYVHQQTVRKLLPYQKINHFPGSNYIGNKSHLFRTLNKLKKRFPFQFDFYPETYILPDDINELKKLNPQKIWIAKPQSENQGKGITIHIGLKKVPQSCVLQEYITPFLIDNLKFDLRLYVLLRSVSPLKIYYYQEGLTRFATNKYFQASSENLNNQRMHLTNYAINKKDPGFIFNDDPLNDSIGHKRSYSSTLRSIGVNIPILIDQIEDLIIKTIVCSYNKLHFTYKNCVGGLSDNCFQIFGFDILIGRNLKPLLLQVNHVPCLRTDTPLDYNIKKYLLIDTFNLLNIKKKEISNMGTKMMLSSLNQDIKLGGYKLIYPKSNKKEEFFRLLMFDDSIKDYHFKGLFINRSIQKNEKIKKIEEVQNIKQQIIQQHQQYVQNELRFYQKKRLNFVQLKPIDLPRIVPDFHIFRSKKFRNEIHSRKKTKSNSYNNKGYQSKMPPIQLMNE